jgi:hypothetical protein
MRAAKNSTRALGSVMTTNVFDGQRGVIATDSRWSMPWGSHRIIYVDDSQYDKIELFSSVAFVFAGKGVRIQAWKDWIRSGGGQSTKPTVAEMSICIVETSNKSVLFKQGEDISKDGALFAGTGARPAFQCWQTNGDAKRSVESAKLVDHFTGGEVKFFDCTSRQHNLFFPVTKADIGSVCRAIEERGIVMDISSTAPASIVRPPFKLSDLAANDAMRKEVSEKIASGELTPEAPCDAMHNEWTEDQKARLDSALASIFQW